MSKAEAFDMPEHVRGYLDGHDPDCPWPGDNHSHVYRHCFEVANREREGIHWPADVARRKAAAAYLADGLPVPDDLVAFIAAKEAGE